MNASRLALAVVLCLAPELVNAQSMPRAQGPRKYALVIGITGYSNYAEQPALEYADDDALKFQQLLRAQIEPFSRIETLLNRDATKARIARAINQFAAVLRAEDTIFVYFAGHAAVAPRTGEIYLVPFDARRESLDRDGFNVRSFVESLASKLRTGRIVVFLDTCFSGSVVSAVRLRSTWVERLKNVTAFVSSQDDEPTWEIPSVGGIFTAYVIEGLRGAADRESGNGDGAVQAGELATYLVRFVPQATERAVRVLQVPGSIVPRPSLELARFQRYSPAIPAVPRWSDRQWLEHLVQRFTAYASVEFDVLQNPSTNLTRAPLFPRAEHLLRAIAEYALAARVTEVEVAGHIGDFCLDAATGRLASPIAPVVECDYIRAEYALALGDRIARIVADLLVTYGVPRNALRTISYGAERPFNEEKNPFIAFQVNRAAARNNRIELRTIGSDTAASGRNAELSAVTAPPPRAAPTGGLPRATTRTTTAARRATPGARARKIRIAKSPLGYVNVRQRADRGSAVVARVRPGETYTVSAVASGWYRIDAKGGWVARQYVVEQE